MIWNSAQAALARKDMREAMSTKMIKVTMMIVPVMLGVFMPTMMTVGVYFGQTSNMGDIDSVLKLLPINFTVTDTIKALYYYMMNYLVPVFFTLIPVMAASIAAGSSFVGEKERRTLTTLIASPLTVKQLFTSKVMGALAMALMVTGISFIGFLIVAIVGGILVYGGFVLDIGIWAVMLLLIAPSISLVSVTAMVMASAKASTFQEAQQYAVIIVLPVMALLMVPQVAGLFLYNAPQLAIVGAAFLAIAIVLMRLAAASFTPEKLLK